MSNPYEDIIDFLQTMPEYLEQEYPERQISQEEMADKVVEMLGIPKDKVLQLAKRLEDSHPYPDVVGQLLKSHQAHSGLLAGTPAQTEEEERLRVIALEGIVGRNT